jgi:hypothetical protein
MDVKGAKALRERLAEAARKVDPTPPKAVGSGETAESQSSPTRRRRGNCGAT